MQSTEMQKSVSVQVDSDFALFLPGGVYEIKKMEPRSKLRKVILFCLLLSLFGMVAFGYFCPDQKFKDFMTESYLMKMLKAFRARSVPAAAACCVLWYISKLQYPACLAAKEFFQLVGKRYKV
ncbi:unnamed protein product [Pieris macdunnoughi]|uniref:Uncharacterized protein n=1 Tax=Pieris macdunnoughi TaxID=345717 RepID=A0A821W301_9NEOP|nr:unnamed protein product [Pieris macdunnoughi]